MRPGILCGLALRVIEVGRHGDNCLRDRRREEALSVSLELAQDVSRNLRWGEAKLAQLNAWDFTGINVPSQAEGKQLQLVLESLRVRGPSTRLTE